MWEREEQNLLWTVFERRVGWLQLLIVIVIVVLAGRVIWLQLIRGKQLYRVAQENSIQVIRQPSPRGIIFDSNGTKLAINHPAFSVVFRPVDIDEETSHLVLDKLSNVLGVHRKWLEEQYQRVKREPFGSFLVAENVSRGQVFYISAHGFEMPGVEIESSPLRRYPYHEMGAHVLGHLGQITADELSRLGLRGYRAGDVIGKAGVETAYDEYLRGRDGARQIEVDSRGKRIRLIKEIEAESGSDVLLTLDWRLQEICEKALYRHGVVCALQPETGEVLALVSKPSFDPNLFAWRISRKEWNQLFEDESCPMLNRAVRGRYAPASTFKVITALAGLETGSITPATVYGCEGSFPVGNRVFRCWREEGHGRLTVVPAIVDSCDVFFYQAGLACGPEEIAKYAKEFGLGERTRIDIGPEEEGFVPSKEWKRRNYGMSWFPGDTANLSIGQGWIEVTPLQMAIVASAIANGGKIITPYLVDRVVHHNNGEVILENTPKIKRTLSLKPETLMLIRQGMEGVVESGTGQASKVRGLRVAGKTGTAENPRGDDHGWFICYAPADAPEIALVVLTEHGGMGGASAAPIAGRILREYFSVIR